MTDYVLGDRGTVEVITNDFYDAEILQVFEELQVDRERIWNGEARLVPEPDNPYEPSSIAVYIDDYKVGRMSPELSAQYWQPITRVIASGYDAIVHLQLLAVLRRISGENIIESQGLLSLSPPSTLFPLNHTPAHSTLLPQGPSMKVLDEKDHSEYLHSILPPSGEARVILTLEINQQKQVGQDTVDMVDVLHDRKLVGRLSTQMSEQLAPLIRYARERNKLTSAWGTIRGNALEISLTVQALRTQDIPAEWFEELPNNVPELLPIASAYTVTTSFAPAEGEVDREAYLRKKQDLVESIAAHQNRYDTESSTPSRRRAPDTPDRRLAVLLAILGLIFILAGLGLVFWKALLGVVSLAFGVCFLALALYMGRTSS
ncbi:MAG: hypothetical protein Q4C74_01140 [Rothia sp. (in: high G+C Gram-positive bacteria)]|nr:hypothetical protein [Rothia sp. (in: high G+C Gram-positive bacteria)]